MTHVVSLDALRATRAGYPAAAPEERVVRHVGDLAEFLADEVTVTVWPRADLSADTLAAARRAASRGLCLETVVDAVAGAARAAAEEALADADPAGALADDVEALAAIFADLVGADRIGLRLRALGHAMCPRFHVDRVPLRMLCTYCGEGTEWLAAADVDRRLLRAMVGAGGCDPAQRPGAKVRTARPGHVVLLKGEAWPGHEGRGAVHRSPAVATDRRLMLSLELV